MPGRGGLSGYLLAWTAALWFCSGLVGLAVAPSLGVAVPRWLILVNGVGCALLALLAPLLGRRVVAPLRQELQDGDELRLCNAALAVVLSGPDEGTPRA
jgi:hypothetical protein